MLPPEAADNGATHQERYKEGLRNWEWMDFDPNTKGGDHYARCRTKEGPSEHGVKHWGKRLMIRLLIAPRYTVKQASTGLPM